MKTDKSTHQGHHLSEDDQPPIMGTWNRLYILVLVIHVAFITLFYLITKSLS